METKVISLHSALVKKNELITRMKNTPRSNLLKCAKTASDLGIVKAVGHNETIRTIFSYFLGDGRQPLESILNQELVKRPNIRLSDI